MSEGHAGLNLPFVPWSKEREVVESWQQGRADEEQFVRTLTDALQEARAALLLDLDEGHDPARDRAVKVVEGALDLIRLRGHK